MSPSATYPQIRMALPDKVRRIVAILCVMCKSAAQYSSFRIDMPIRAIEQAESQSTGLVEK